MSSLDPGAIGMGALADLVLLAALVTFYAVARAVGSETLGTVTIVIASLLPPVVGGFVAGRQQRRAPLTNGAVAAGLATLVYVAVRVADAAVRGTTLHPASAVIFAMLGGTLGLLGGFAGFRTARR